MKTKVWKVFINPLTTDTESYVNMVDIRGRIDLHSPQEAILDVIK